MEVLLGLIAVAAVGYFLYRRFKNEKPASPVSPGAVKPVDNGNEPPNRN